MSMYVRIKREKLTIFLHVEPTDTVSQVKSKLEELIQQVEWEGDQGRLEAPAPCCRRRRHCRVLHRPLLTRSCIG